MNIELLGEPTEEINIVHTLKNILTKTSILNKTMHKAIFKNELA